MLTVPIQLVWKPALSLNRPRRVLLLLGGVWALQALDLYFTLSAHRSGVLGEMNPLAAWALRFGLPGAIGFKLALVGLASAALLRYRTRASAERLLCIVLVVCIGLSLRWHKYHHILAGYAPTWETCSLAWDSLPPGYREAVWANRSRN